MQWIILLLAGIFEIIWACAMKFSDGFTVFIPTGITVIGYILSAVFLSLALRRLPIGTSILGIFLFKEKLTVSQIVCIMLIIAGIIGLKLLSD